jgi:hypothetical protein
MLVLLLDSLVVREVAPKLHLHIDHYYRCPRFDTVLDYIMILSIHTQCLIFTEIK